MGPENSDGKIILKRCPQRSTFGPIMWNIFQNNLLPMQGMEASISMYADDHQIYAAGESSKTVEKKLLEGGERTTRWYIIRIIY